MKEGRILNQNGQLLGHPNVNMAQYPLLHAHPSAWTMQKTPLSSQFVGALASALQQLFHCLFPGHCLATGLLVSWVSPGVPPYPSFQIGAGRSSKSGWCSYISGSYAASSLFFRLSGGWLLHNVLTLVFQILMEDLTACLTISRPMVCPRAS